MWLFGLFAFALGGCVGSFLNVVILRLPEDESLWRRGSHCMSCGRPIPPWCNIPIISYIVLRGRCRACSARFSPQYMIVELLTALFFLVTFLYRFDAVVPVLMRGSVPSWDMLGPAVSCGPPTALSGRCCAQ